MIKITITATPVGQAFLFERLKRQGRRVLVPTYQATATSEDESTFVFAVTRDSSSILFLGQKERFGTYGECPPSIPNRPYLARPSLLSSNQTFCLRLFEPNLSDKHNKLIGQGNVVRSDIMIHRGPGRSVGCIQIAGGKKGHRSFTRWFKSKITSKTEIQVTVLPLP